MEEEFDDTHEKIPISSLVERYESLVKHKEQPFFSEESFLDIIEFYLDGSQRDRILEAIKFGLKIYPHSLDLLLYKAELLSEQMMFDEAFEALELAALFHPSDERLQMSLGVTHIHSGNYEKGLEILHGIENDVQENLGNFYSQIAMAYSYMDQAEMAYSYYKKACRSGNANQFVYLDLLMLIEEMGVAESALKFFEELIDKDPYNYLAWYSLGFLKIELGDKEGGRIALDYSVTIDEDFAAGWIQLGQLSMNEQDYTRAIGHYQRAIVNEEDLESLTDLAAAYEALEDYTQAMKYYKRTTELDEFWDEGWYGIASVLYEQGKYLESIHFIKKAIKLNEFNADYACLLGDSEAKLGNIVSAEEAYGKAIVLDPLHTNAWLNWSIVYFDQQIYDKAYELIEDAIIELPSEGDLYYRACVYLLYDGKIKHAYDYLQQALILDYNGHTQLFDYFSNLETLKALQRIIDQNRK
ncbi:MAG: tetratricopeptide repeat protein [Leadbetterella sp.]